MECKDCKWRSGLTNSRNEVIYYCVNTESGAYLSEVGYCSECEEGESDESIDE